MSTKVIFRKEKKTDEILAVFPAMAGDTNPYRTCTYYCHETQHGTMAIDYMKETRPLWKRSDYQDLYNELVSIGYDDLEVATRITRKDLQARINEVNNQPVAR